MRPEEFIARHQSLWEELEAYMSPAKPEKAQPTRDGATLAHWPSKYRQVCQHLELARERHYPLELIERLNHLVVAGQAALYGHRDGIAQNMARLVRLDFPRRVRQEWRVVVLACILFFGTLIATGLLGYFSRDFAEVTLGRATLEQFDRMYGGSRQRLGQDRGSEDDVLMFGFYIYNNTKIGFQTFASGLLLGLGTAFYLIFNGVQLGTVMGYMATTANAERFYSFVAGHGSFELTAIALAGGAGLMLGRAIAFPGRRRRLDALRAEAASGIVIVYGAAVFFLIAAFIEAFWSANASIDPFVKYIVGAVLWLLVIGYLTLAGRRAS
jgi:uncharacterized membrane protein SpoIIM required for sporulation